MIVTWKTTSRKFKGRILIKCLTILLPVKNKTVVSSNFVSFKYCKKFKPIPLCLKHIKEKGGIEELRAKIGEKKIKRFNKNE